MTIIDRYTGNRIDETCLPDNIELGRYAIVNNGVFTELTNRTYKPRDGQRIRQELLDPVNKDKHDVFEEISNHIELGDFSAVPLLQGIKQGLVFGNFELALEEKLNHIEAIFHDPYSKLNRSIEKVPVSKAKRISNRSNQYLAAHTEDWLLKTLISFHPSRILTEEVTVDENVYENQLLIAFVTRSARYLERRLSHTRDISKFLEDYARLMDKYNNNSGWYKRVRRELSLAGKVYDEEGSNYKGGGSNIDIVNSTRRRLRKLRDALLKLRQFDLYNTVDQRKIDTIQYHDTNVLVNHKHYKYLKELWVLLVKDERNNSFEDKVQADDGVISNVRDYGLSLLNYVISDVEYLGYKVEGNDMKWHATRKDCPSMALACGKEGTINLTIGGEQYRFITICGIPPVKEEIPENTFVLAYDNSEGDVIPKSPRILPISLKDVSSAERIAVVIREILFRQYLLGTIYRAHEFPRILGSYEYELSDCVKSIRIDKKNDTYIFIHYPNNSVNKDMLLKELNNNVSFKLKNRMERKSITEAVESFVEQYKKAAINLEELKCFAFDCDLFLNRKCENLNYIECACGIVIDSTDFNHVLFYKKGAEYPKEEMGMDYLDIKLDLKGPME